MTQRHAPDEPRVRAWETRAQWPLAVAAVLFLIAFAWPVLQPDLGHSWRTACRITTVVTWVAFLVDYAARLTLARHRTRFVRTHLLDLAVVVLPVLRPLSLLRLILLLRVVNRQATASLRGRIAAHTATATVIVVLCAALAALSAERGRAGANIDSFGNAVWWAVTTITTVGYGDLYPVTVTGRVVAVVLMVGGVALIGTVTAGLSSWFVDLVRGDAGVAAPPAPSAAGTDPQALSTELQQLRHEIATLRAALAGPAAPDEPPVG